MCHDVTRRPFLFSFLLVDFTYTYAWETCLCPQNITFLFRFCFLRFSWNCYCFLFWICFCFVQLLWFIYIFISLYTDWIDVIDWLAYVYLWFSYKKIHTLTRTHSNSILAQHNSHTHTRAQSFVLRKTFHTLITGCDNFTCCFHVYLSLQFNWMYSGCK